MKQRNTVPAGAAANLRQAFLPSRAIRVYRRCRAAETLPAPRAKEDKHGMETPRLLGIKTPLGEGAFTLVKLSVTEELGLPYVIEAEVLGTNPELLPQDMLTKEITCTITQRNGDAPLVRHFNGVVASFSRIAPGAAGRMVYRLVAVPKLWQLGLRRNCRIFQDKTAKQIITEVLQDHGLPEPTWNMAKAEAIPYCTQFNETDLAFVSRLLEEHGLTLYFTQAAGGQEACVAGNTQAFPLAEQSEVRAVHDDPGLLSFGGWRRTNRARGFMTKFEDMDEERSKPADKLTEQRATRTYIDEPSMWGGGEDFLWPGGMSTRPGNTPAEFAMAAQEAASEEYAASSLDPRYIAGSRLFVSVVKEDGSAPKRQYIVSGVRHQAVDNSTLVAGAGAVEHYHAALTLVLAGRVYVPQARHPRPVMAGLQSAKVTGPAGEKIHVDAHGRVKVKFRWDRLGKDDDTSSCFVRVMQSAAGAWGGTWFLPRVGDEVLVAFLEGDPDRPVVVGSVYSKDAQPPFKPGSNKAQSGISTRSYKSDAAADANVLRFEDKKGSEEVLVHAQKDLTVEVENDEKRDVGNDQTETIKNKRSVTIDQSDDILTLKQGNRTITIKMGNQDTTVEMGNVSLTLSMGNESHKLKMGNFELKCDLGAITLEAMQSITLKVGQSSVVVDQMGVTTKGMMIQSEAQLLHKTKTLMLQEKADALAQIEGGIVLIN